MVFEMSLTWVMIVRDRADGFDRALGVDLDAFDLAADVFGGFRGFLGELFHFVGDDGKTFARFAGARGFDGGVEGEQVGLLRDRGDDLDDLADFDAGFAEFADGGVGGLRRFDGFGGDFGGLGGVLGDFLDGDAHLFAAGGDGLEVAVDLFAGGGDDVGLRGGFFGVGAHLLADGREFAGGSGERRRGLADLADAGAQIGEQLREPGAHLADGVLAADVDFLGEIAARRRRDSEEHGVHFAAQIFGGGFLRRDVAGVFDDFERLAVQIEDRVVGSLNPDFAAALADALVFAALEFALIQFRPEFAVVGTGAVIFFDEDAVMLALDLVGHIAERAQEVVVGLDDRAVHAKLDDRLRLADGGDLPGIVGVVDFLRGDVGGVLDDLERLAVQIEDRVVGSLNPDFLAAFADAAVFAGLVFAAVQLGPEFAVFGARAVRFVGKHAVMLAFDFVERVAHRLEEILVGVDDGAVHAEIR